MGPFDSQQESVQVLITWTSKEIRVSVYALSSGCSNISAPISSGGESSKAAWLLAGIFPCPPDPVQTYTVSCLAAVHAFILEILARGDIQQQNPSESMFALCHCESCVSSSGITFSRPNFALLTYGCSQSRFAGRYRSCFALQASPRPGGSCAVLLRSVPFTSFPTLAP